jgi:DNA invertase Pin-like site-specific DNA recombinase
MGFDGSFRFWQPTDHRFEGEWATGGMLKIGYVRLRDPGSAQDTAALMAAGCQVVRAEEPSSMTEDESEVLDSLLDFITADDQLVVARLEHLGTSARAIVDVLDRLTLRGASLQLLAPNLSSLGVGGQALRAALEAVSILEPGAYRRRSRNQPAATADIRALQASGMGPVEIAKRLGVSRMTIWRKLKADA